MWNVWYPIILIALAVALPNQGRADDSDFENNAEAQWNRVAADVSQDYAAYEKRELQSWRDYQKRIKQKWADDAIPEQKTYVEYSQDDTARIKVDYEHGTLTAEALLDPNDKSQARARSKVQSALSAVVTVGDSPSSVLSQDEIDTAAAATAEMSEEATTAGDSKPRTLYRIKLQLLPDFTKRRAAKFKPLVDTWAAKYHLDSAYLLAIIQQESCFNPRARSWVPALGLMQIVPYYAGQEVMQAVTGKATIPDEDFLYDPAKNIMVGATYLQLLRDQYFPNIKDTAKRMYLMTASYNWGPHRLKKAIAQGRIPASASSDDTFDIIQRIAPAETKNYVRRVIEFYIQFKKEGL